MEPARVSFGSGAQPGRPQDPPPFTGDASLPAKSIDFCGAPSGAGCFLSTTFLHGEVRFLFPGATCRSSLKRHRQAGTSSPHPAPTLLADLKNLEMTAKTEHLIRIKSIFAPRLHQHKRTPDTMLKCSKIMGVFLRNRENKKRGGGGGEEGEKPHSLRGLLFPRRRIHHIKALMLESQSIHHAEHNEPIQGLESASRVPALARRRRHPGLALLGAGSK